MAGLTTRHSLTCALGYRTPSWPRARRCGALALAVVRLISVSTLMGSATMSAFAHREYRQMAMGYPGTLKAIAPAIDLSRVRTACPSFPDWIRHTWPWQGPTMRPI